MGLANRNCLAICASRPVSAYISAAWIIGSDLTAWHPFAVISIDTLYGAVYLRQQPVSRLPCKTIYLLAAELPNHFLMHSFCVEDSPSTFLTVAAVDDIMKTGGWKTESTVQQKIWATCSVQVGRKRKCSQRDAADSELLLPHVREVIEAILRTFG